MISVVVTGRNDDYGGGFVDRLRRAVDHNASLLAGAGVEFEFVLAEWNPLPDRPLLSLEFVRNVPCARAVVIPAEIHRAYSLSATMDFHEMPAKNAALRRAAGEFVIVTNADVLFGESVVNRLKSGDLRRDTLYRAHRIDVKPGLTWAEMKDPASQLLSGEGKRPPCWYLGAGGDFCLASHSLWNDLRGFNERVRFSTRAKDWQFFLSAGAQGVDVEFIGDVYHLDHELGFRNAAPAQAGGPGAHFGGPWDIEFGLPVRNNEDWGFNGLSEIPEPDDPRVVVLDGAGYRTSRERDRADRALAEWLGQPSEPCIESTAKLLHALAAAQLQRRRLVCRLRDVRLAVALASFAPVAEAGGVPVSCNWSWPCQEGFTLTPFTPEPEALSTKDWIADDDGGGSLTVRNAVSGEAVHVLPRRLPADSPVFNPLLARRLLRAVLSLQGCGARRIGIYGAGSHTRELLSWGLPDSIDVAAIVSSRPGPQMLNRIPIVRPGDVRGLELDAILVSSASFEPELVEAAEGWGVGMITTLYRDWPRFASSRVQCPVSSSCSEVLPQ